MSMDVSTESSGDSRPDGKHEVRQRVHGMWAAVADAWGTHADYVDTRAAPITKRFIDRTGPVAGNRVLELACGPGGAGLEFAPIVGPSGEVVLSDVAAAMTEIAVTRARARGFANVRGRVLDLEAIAESDASFDIVVCREGLMFALEPSAAAREMVRVLRPGGRLALSVWGSRADNPWLGLVFDAASEVLGRPVPPPGIPGPFSLGEAGQLAGTLAGAGIGDLRIEEVAVGTRAPSLKDFLARTSALAGPLTKILAGMPQAARDAMEARLVQTLQPYQSDAGLQIPGLALVASGRRK
jgi:ubiquinone/menaquinone biosynthesis C-methylase UbiE